MDNYPPKFLSMRTIFQRGNIEDEQLNEIQQNAINTINGAKKENCPNEAVNNNLNQYMTPNTKKLYAFGESSSIELQSIFRSNAQVPNTNKNFMKPPRPQGGNNSVSQILAETKDANNMKQVLVEMVKNG